MVIWDLLVSVSLDNSQIIQIKNSIVDKNIPLPDHISQIWIEHTLKIMNSTEFRHLLNHYENIPPTEESKHFQLYFVVHQN